MTTQLLQLEQQRTLLEKRKQDAMSACREAESQLETVKKELSVHDAMLKERKGAIATLEGSIDYKTDILAMVGREIDERTATRDEMVKAYWQTEVELQEHQSSLLATGVSLDSRLSQLEARITTAQTELCNKEAELHQKAEELLNIITLVDDEQKRLNYIIITQESELQKLVEAREEGVRRGEALTEKEEELYTLRSDLDIIKERYAEFARENNLPFNV